MLCFKGLNMRKIGKVSTVLFTALLAALVLMPLAKPAYAGVEKALWLPPYVENGKYVDGAEAKLKIAVKCPSYVWPDAWDSIVVTAVSIVFHEWGDINKTLTTSKAIDKEQWAFFEVNFTASVEEFTELISHDYYVQVNFKINGTKPERWQYTRGFLSLPYFRVISQDQKDAMDLSAKYEAYEDAYPPYSFWTISAEILANQAVAEAAIAENLWTAGDYAGAKAHYQNAVDLYEQAFEIDGDKGMYWQEAEVNATVKEADAAMLTAQAVMNQSYGYILFGLGFIIMGIGVVIYAAKKPKTS